MKPGTKATRRQAERRIRRIGIQDRAKCKRLGIPMVTESTATTAAEIAAELAAERASR